ncbi:MAG: hypothetical protein FJ117_21985 [Deltaproteobacteria bacterium]|nr:hypothetical protein [Deltaproteobacteria bacterium]
MAGWVANFRIQEFRQTFRHLEDLGSKSISLNPTEEVEEPCQISTGHETGGIQISGSQKDMDQDGSLAISATKRGSLHVESWMGQTPRLIFLNDYTN